MKKLAVAAAVALALPAYVQSIELTGNPTCYGTTCYFEYAVPSSPETCYGPAPNQSVRIDVYADQVHVDSWFGPVTWTPTGSGIFDFKGDLKDQTGAVAHLSQFVRYGFQRGCKVFWEYGELAIPE